MFAKRSDTHQLRFAKVMGFAKSSTHPPGYSLQIQVRIERIFGIGNRRWRYFAHKRGCVWRRQR
jgi:hypothetical protein